MTMWKKTRKTKTLELEFKSEFESEWKAEELELYVVWNKVTQSHRVSMLIVEVCGVVALDPPRRDTDEPYKASILQDIENPARIPYIEVLIQRKKKNHTDQHRILIDGNFWALEFHKPRAVPVSVVEQAARWQLTRTEMFLIERAATDFVTRLNRDPKQKVIWPIPFTEKRRWYVLKDRDQFMFDGLYNIHRTWPKSYPCLSFFTTKDIEYLYINEPDNPESVFVRPGL